MMRHGRTELKSVMIVVAATRSSNSCASYDFTIRNCVPSLRPWGPTAVAEEVSPASAMSSEATQKKPGNVS